MRLLCILFFIGFFVTAQKTVATLKAEFDAITLETSYQQALASSGDGSDLYYVDPARYIKMFQATGQDSYADTAVDIIERAIASSINVAGGYKGWPDDNSGVDPTGVGVNDGSELALPESRGFGRNTAYTLWVLSNSPTYLAKGTNQAKYNTILAFLKTNLWEKWYTRGIGNLYRSHVHMMSHWAQIGWCLNEIEPNAQYRKVFDDFNTNVSAGSFNGSMRGNLRTVALTGGNGYVWAGAFGSTSGRTDTSHANAEIELIMLAAENDDYWNATDIANFVRTADQRILKSASQSAYWVDGTQVSNSQWLDEGWIGVGRFNAALALRFEGQDATDAYRTKQRQKAEQAYNRAYINNSLYYPESDAPEDTTPPTIESVQVIELSDTDFKVRWTLDEPSTGQVQYGFSIGSYPYTTIQEFGYYTLHTQLIGNNGANPTPGQTVYYRVQSFDAAGNEALSPEYSQTTTGAPIEYYKEFKNVVQNGKRIRGFLNGKRLY